MPQPPADPAPSDKRHRASLIREAATAARQGELGNAIALYQQALGLEETPDLQLRLAQLLTKAGRWDEARHMHERLSQVPSDASLFWRATPLYIEAAGPAREAVGIDPGTLWDVGRQLMRHPRELLRLPALRGRLSRQRRLNFVAARGLAREAENANVIENAVAHNLNMLDSSSDDGARPDRLIQPLAAIDYVATHAAEMKVLTIGPRSETEIFCLIAAGFRLENISAIDLISYSPLVAAGDMHALPYADESFDAIIAGWVLAYSRNTPLAAAEIIRVARPNAYVAVGCAHTPPEKPMERKDHAGTRFAGTRFSAVEDITGLFAPAISHIYFSGRVERERAKSGGSVSAIFQVKAPG